MPLLPDQLANLPTAPGVYIFRGAQNKPLYIGKAVNLKARVSSYFQQGLSLGKKTALMVGRINKIDHIATETELEALLLEADLIKRLRPRYNIQWKDDKGYSYIEISNYKFLISKKLKGGLWPYVRKSRKTDDPTAIYFGPFPQGRTVNDVLRTLRKIFPWCKYKGEAAKRRAKRPCFYHQIGLCPGICADKITLQEYQQIINQLVEFLKGNKKRLIQQLEREMKKTSREKTFEKAAYLRDQIQKMLYVTQSFRDSSKYIQNPNLLEDQRRKELDELLKVIDLKVKRYHPFQIEAYDISNLGSQQTVGSRVVFVEGEADKSGYRRYRIRHEKLPDDIAAIKEVLHRRFYKASDQPPNLILIDGGKSQLSAALQVLSQLNLKIPVLGLAKRTETLILPSTKGEFVSINLEKDSLALKLLQRIRDEAHRFAIKYHRSLRQKTMLT